MTMGSFESLPFATVAARWATGGRTHVVAPGHDVGRWLAAIAEADRPCVVAVADEAEALLWAAALGKPLLRPGRPEAQRQRAAEAPAVVVAIDHLDHDGVRAALVGGKLGACWLVPRADRQHPDHPASVGRGAKLAAALEPLRARSVLSLWVDARLCPPEAISVLAAGPFGSLRAGLRLPPGAAAFSGGDVTRETLSRSAGFTTITDVALWRLGSGEVEKLEASFKRGGAGIASLTGHPVASVPSRTTIVAVGSSDPSDVAPYGPVQMVEQGPRGPVVIEDLARSWATMGETVLVVGAAVAGPSGEALSAMIAAGIVQAARPVRTRARIADASRFKSPFVDRSPQVAALHARWTKAKSEAALNKAAHLAWLDSQGKDLVAFGAQLGFRVSALGDALLEAEVLGAMTGWLESDDPHGSWEVEIAATPTDAVDSAVALACARAEVFAARRRSLQEVVAAGGCRRVALSRVLGADAVPCGSCDACEGVGTDSGRLSPQRSEVSASGLWTRWVDAVEQQLGRWVGAAGPFTCPDPPAAPAEAGEPWSQALQWASQALAGAEGARNDLRSLAVPGLDTVLLALDVVVRPLELAQRGAAFLDGRGALPPVRALPLARRVEVRSIQACVRHVTLRPRAMTRWLDLLGTETPADSLLAGMVVADLQPDERAPALALFARLKASGSPLSADRLARVLADAGGLPPELVGEWVGRLWAEGRTDEAARHALAGFQHTALNGSAWLDAVPMRDLADHAALAARLDTLDGGSRFSEQVEALGVELDRVRRLRVAILEAAGAGDLRGALRAWWGRNPLGGRGPLAPAAAELSGLGAVRAAMVSELVARAAPLLVDLRAGQAMGSQDVDAFADLGMADALLAIVRGILREEPRHAAAQLTLARLSERARPGPDSLLQWERAIELATDGVRARELVREGAASARARGQDGWADRMMARTGA